MASFEQSDGSFQAPKRKWIDVEDRSRNELPVSWSRARLRDSDEGE
jgi:hypothetical protein